MSSEKELISWLSTQNMHNADDTAILPFSKTHYQLLTTDMSVEQVHFKTSYATLKQIGYKALISNISDIASMGGVPKQAVVSVGLPTKNNLKILKEISQGITKAAKQYSLSIVGGDLTASKKIIISIALTGLVSKNKVVKRSGAKPNDILYVSNTVGDSSIGLELLNQKKKGKCIQSHLMPSAHVTLGQQLAALGVHSMIDTSDGLATSVHQLCEASTCGAIVFQDQLPISKATIHDHKKLKTRKPLETFALYGGEDYQLVFSAPQSLSKKLATFPVTPIGILTKEQKIRLQNEHKTISLKRGFDHFKKQ